MTKLLSLITLSTGVVLAWIFALIGSSSPVPGADPLPVARSFTIEEQELVDFAYSRFAVAGIELPDVSIQFVADRNRCYGYGGVYLPSRLVVRICRPSKSTMVHELAHAWVETTLNDSDRAAFLDLRDLQTWTGGEQWNQQGAEHAAEIITWAIMDKDITIRWVETNDDGTTSDTRRLFKIPDSDPDRLISAYQQLTGDMPAERMSEVASEVEPVSGTTSSPEARKYQTGDD